MEGPTSSWSAPLFILLKRKIEHGQQRAAMKNATIALWEESNLRLCDSGALSNSVAHLLTALYSSVDLSLFNESTTL